MGFCNAQAQTVDVAIVGAGPAGLATAAELAEYGFTVQVLDPNAFAHWPNNYGAWLDELTTLGYTESVAQQWGVSTVHLPHEKLILNRSYARIDRAQMKHQLMQRIQKRGGGIADDAVLEHFQSQKDTEHELCSTLHLQSGAVVHARLVLDASGYPGKLCGAPSYDPLGPGYQAAIGLTIRCSGGHGFAVGEMVFMDWTSDHLHGSQLEQSSESIPTFLYAMPFDEEVMFVEETSLVARPSAPLELCRERLHARLQHLGLQYELEEPEEELCLIPMGGRLPDYPQHSTSPVPVGAAGGFVHPATGYSVIRSLTAAKRIASSLATTDSHIDAYTAWHSLWPASEARRRAFFLFGMEVLLALNLSGLRSFFAAFFTLEDRLWQGFLSGTLPLPALLELGLKLFVRASPRTKVELLKEGGRRVPMLVQQTLKSS